MGNLTKRSKTRETRLFVIPNGVIVGDRDKIGSETHLSSNQQLDGTATTVGETTTDFVELGSARDKVLSLKLDQASSSASGLSTSINPKDYLTNLNSVVLKSKAKIGDNISLPPSPAAHHCMSSCPLLPPRFKPTLSQLLDTTCPPATLSLARIVFVNFVKYPSHYHGLHFLRFFSPFLSSSLSRMLVTSPSVAHLLLCLPVSFSAPRSAAHELPFSLGRI